MDSIQGAKFRWLWLSRTLENQGVQLDQLQRIEQLQDDRAPAGHFGIGKAGAQPQTVDGS